VSGEPQFAVDTSFVIAVLKGTVRSGLAMSEIAFPVPVVGELRFGALNGRDPQRRLAEIEELVSQGTILASEGATARVYSEIRVKLRASGTPLPENDLWIAATCLQHGLPLLTLNRHFERIDGLKLANSAD
jgi:tRNA(fMet)-specific endonuclease VapC